MAYLPLRTVIWIEQQFESKLKKYNVEEYIINEFEKILLLNDSLALFVKISKQNVLANIDKQEMSKFANNPYLDVVEYGSEYFSLEIEEVTYNELGFKHNQTKFVRDLCSIMKISYLNHTMPEIDGTSITYTRFKGYSRLYWCPDVLTTVEYVERAVPQLRLRERYNLWQGLKYYFIIIEFIDIYNEIHRAVAYTTQKPHIYIQHFANHYLKDGHIIGEVRTRYTVFDNALASWKGTPRKIRLEKNLKYCFIEKCFREKDDVWRYADQVLKDANEGIYDKYEKSNYLKPINKWISEEMVYKTVKKIYKEYAVIYQYRPFFLKSSNGGQMSYDVFISKLNIAIEYQGKQHFEPVEFFGGEESFIKLQQRDKEKAELSRKNGVKLVYVNYWENINPQLIRQKIDEIMLL